MKSCNGMCPSKVVNILEMAAGDLGLRKLDQRNREKDHKSKRSFNAVSWLCLVEQHLLVPC